MTQIDFDQANWATSFVNGIVDVRKVDPVNEVYQVFVGEKPLTPPLAPSDPQIILAKQIVVAVQVAVTNVAGQAIEHTQAVYEEKRRKEQSSPNVKMMTNRISPDSMK